MSNQQKHRVAIIGCGSMAQVAHLPHAQQNPRIDLVATCDLNPKLAEECRVRFGAERAESDWRKIVEAKDIDLCILATHTNLRGQFIIPALESGKAVYTEKPLATTRQEMMEIVRAARRTGRPVCVGHNRRSGPAVLEFKRLLTKAKSGVAAIKPSVDYSGSRKPIPEESQLLLLLRMNDDIRCWHNWTLEDKDGVLLADMVHHVDVALWVNDAHPVRVFAEGSVRGNFAIMIRFSDGSLTNIHYTMVGNFDYPRELFEATTRNITIAMDEHMEVRQYGMADEPVQTFFPLAEGTEWVTGRGAQGYMEALALNQQRSKNNEKTRWVKVNKGIANHLDRFLTHLEGKGENPCEVESAVAVSNIVFKLLESARLGLPVAINPEDWHIPILS